MIRDPSDGSVREPKSKAPMTSGLPPIDPVDQVLKEREARSREWLKQYRARQLDKSNDRRETAVESEEETGPWLPER